MRGIAIRWFANISIIIMAFNMPIQVTPEKHDSLVLGATTVGDTAEYSFAEQVGAYLEIAQSIQSDEVRTKTYEKNDELGFTAGIQNGLLGLGSYVKDILTASYVDATEAGGLFMSILMFLWGLIKNAFDYFFDAAAFLFTLLLQSANASYYIGYVLAIALYGGLISVTYSWD
ncbi:MAG: hypothetical protein ATN35_03355 [Epulopiscium sp. Nele67-Bin004]|nr:MAG: hypothetical protein ATN35_03355 [Epulopiscium sp. Nele67-Bin004]